jgi:hypothetical protein
MFMESTFSTYLTRCKKKKLVYLAELFHTEGILHIPTIHDLWARTAQSVQTLATGWTVGASNPGDYEIFRPCLGQSWDPPRLLYIGHPTSFVGVKRLEGGVNHPLPSGSEAEERVDILLLYDT